MTLEPILIVAVLCLVFLAFYVAVEHVPKWLAALAASGRGKPFEGIRTLLAPIALPGWVKGLGVILWVILFVTLLLGTFHAILTALALLPSVTDASDATRFRAALLTITAMTATLGAVIALPFTLRRTIQNERQTRTAEEGYVTQQINEAVRNLAAEKEVSRVWRTVDYNRAGQITREIESTSDRHVLPDDVSEDEVRYGDWQLGHRTKPNIEVRIGAILALERLARQRADVAVRDKEASLAAEKEALAKISGKAMVEALAEREMTLDRLGHRTPDGILDQDAARDHVRIMEILCAYIRENAPAARARPLTLTPWPELKDDATLLEIAGYRENCRRHGADWEDELTSGALAHRGPRSDTQTALRVIGRRTAHQRTCEGVGTIIFETRWSTELRMPHWRGYRLDLRRTDLQMADLAHSWERPMMLAHARLDGAQMQRANLGGAQLQGASLWSAHMEGAIVWFAKLHGCTLRYARLQGSDLRRTEMIGADIGATEMQGAILSDAQLQGAHIDPATDLKVATLRGSALRSHILWANRVVPDLLTQCFGDGSVRFEGDWPEGFVIPRDGVLRADTEGRLAHWSPDVLDDDEFEKRWREFQAGLDGTPQDPG